MVGAPMDGQLIANAFHHAYWGFPLALYFWLVGGSAGSFVVSTLGWVFGVKKYKPIAFFASNAAILLLMIVPLLLITDLGKPFRFFHLLMLPSFSHFSAPMVWGALFILTYPIGMLFYSYYVYYKNERMARICGIVAIILALCTHWYTGVVMQLNPSRLPNHGSVAPILFLTGAYISGIGLLNILLWIRNRFVDAAHQVSDSILGDMARLMLYGIVFDMFLLFNEFLQMTYGIGEEHAILYEVLLGPFRWPYLYIEIIWGLIIPLIILVIPQINRKRYWVLGASFMVATGVFGMRVWWVMASQYFQGHF
ncbi:MAG: NrfD/PsrC family molybdoenzyme membrane anchor subunit [Mariprofundaceae bacterium]